MDTIYSYCKHEPKYTMGTIHYKRSSYYKTLNSKCEAKRVSKKFKKQKLMHGWFEYTLFTFKGKNMFKNH